MSWLISYVLAGLVLAVEGGVEAAYTPNLQGPEVRAEKRVEVVKPDSTDEIESFEKVFPLNPGGLFRLSNINGPITVEGWDRREVKVIATISADTRERLSQIEVRFDINPDSVQVETVLPRWTKLEKSAGNCCPKMEVAYQVFLPRDTVIEDIESVNGPVTVTGTSNITHVESTNGVVTVVNVSGEVEVNSVNGTVIGEFNSPDQRGTIGLSSVNGETKLVISSDLNATIKADTTYGKITNDIGLPIRSGRYISGNDLHGRIGDGRAAINLETINGGIVITRKRDGRRQSPVVNLLDSAEAAQEGVRNTSRGTGVATAGGVSESLRAPRQPRGQAGSVRPTSPRAPEAPAVASRPSKPKAPQAVSPPDAQTVYVIPEGGVVGVEEYTIALAPIDIKVKSADQIKILNELIGRNVAAIAKVKEEIKSCTDDAEKVKALGFQLQALDIANKALKDQISQLEKARWDAYKGIESFAYFAPVASGATKVETSQNKFMVSGMPSVNINARDCDVIVRGWDKPEVSYSVSKVMKQPIYTPLAHNGNQNGNEITITVSDIAFVSDQFERLKGPAKSRIEVFVPFNSDLRVRSGRNIRVEDVTGELKVAGSEGTINVRGGEGELVATTTEGAIRVIGFKGAVDARSKDGTINLEGDFAGVLAKTVDGEIVLTLPEDSNANIESNCQNVEAVGLSMEQKSQEEDIVTWEVGKGGATYRLLTDEGQVMVRSSKSLRGDSGGAGK